MMHAPYRVHMFILQRNREATAIRGRRVEKELNDETKSDHRSLEPRSRVLPFVDLFAGRSPSYGLRGAFMGPDVYGPPPSTTFSFSFTWLARLACAIFAP